ncbi:hypothetical protein [Hymenobacter sp. CRA2]|uniref:hypothetical protein n=1 Tax=Hymenobacter sp. CRA2 TaxID=1955620 RepID=UPI00098F523D|nr:hypothetical protein [Hymenobacter sp. CRA2]OON68762.1 hypothetical protein B0919_11280 [Hymenobacter sp. CRA2]
MRTLFAAAALLLAGLSACQSETKPEQTADPAQTESTTLALPAPPADKTATYLADPRVGDVLVVRFVPEGSSTEQFYFYQVFRLSGDTVYTHPARQPAASPDADASRPDVFATEATRAYTKRELVEYQREDPGDKIHSRLVRVRRSE